VQRPHAMLRGFKRVSRAGGFSMDSSRVGRVGSVISFFGGFDYCYQYQGQ
jgi:hypothetical protein